MTTAGFPCPKPTRAWPCVTFNQARPYLDLCSRYHSEVLGSRKEIPAVATKR